MNDNHDFIIKDGVLARYDGPGGDVVIPDGVTEIGACAFSGCVFLTGVSIPDSVVTIGPYAFHKSAGLTRTLIPDSVAEIDGNAFHTCPHLVILASEGSRAERYARKAGIRFETA